MANSTSRVGFDQGQYASQMDGYRQYENLPWGILEHQLQDSALGDCTGMTVLDLGGGQGLRARQAIDHGAVAVDVVDAQPLPDRAATAATAAAAAAAASRAMLFGTDLFAISVSPEMLQAGQKIEERLGMDKTQLQWFEADVSRLDDLARLPLRHKDDGYDLVLANWLFDHAGSMEVLDAMMRACVAYLKPGGRFVGTRMWNSLAPPASKDGRYGVTYKDHRAVPGGVAFRYKVHVDPPVEFEAGSMEATYEPGRIGAFHEKYGLEETQVEPFERASWIRSDPEYWKMFLEEPNFAVVTARKKAV